MTDQPPKWLEDAAIALLPFARQFNAAIAGVVVDLNRRLEEARTMPTATDVRVVIDTTAPVHATTFAELVKLVERYQPDDTWTITATSYLVPVAVVRWHLLRFEVRHLGDLDLARFVVAERARARQQLRRDVVRVATELGLTDLTRFKHPATIVVNNGLTKCHVCRCNVRAGTHRPGSPDCLEDRAVRLESLADR